MDNEIIIIIEGGALQSVYSTNTDISVSLLDYDNMKCAEENIEEYTDYVALEAVLQNNDMKRIW